MDRKGIKFLQDNGVIVHMFDRDLQEVIHKENKLFIEQALERAAEADEEVKAVTLSSFEKLSPLLTCGIFRLRRWNNTGR